MIILSQRCWIEKLTDNVVDVEVGEVLVEAEKLDEVVMFMPLRLSITLSGNFKDQI